MALSDTASSLRRGRGLSPGHRPVQGKFLLSDRRNISSGANEIRQDGLVTTVIVTGSGGLIGSATVEHFIEAGYRVVGIENDTRARLFGPEASTARISQELVTKYPDNFELQDIDIRDIDGV